MPSAPQRNVTFTFYLQKNQSKPLPGQTLPGKKEGIQYLSRGPYPIDLDDLEKKRGVITIIQIGTNPQGGLTKKDNILLQDETGTIDQTHGEITFFYDFTVNDVRATYTDKSASGTKINNFRIHSKSVPYREKEDVLGFGKFRRDDPTPVYTLGFFCEYS